MKPHSGYIPVEANVPFRGLATALPATRIDSAFASDLLNVNVRDGVVRKRAGYLKLGQTLDGIVLGFSEFAPIGVNDKLVVFTSLAQYYFDTATELFVDISVEEIETIDITGADDTGPSFTTNTNLNTQPKLLDNEKFSVVGSVSNDGTYTCNGNPNTVIITDEPIPDDTDTTGDIVIVDRHEILSNSTVTITLVTGLGDVTTDYPVGKVIYIKGSSNADSTLTVIAATFPASSTIIVVGTGTIPNSGSDGYVTRRNNQTYTDGDYINWDTLVDINSKRILMVNGVDVAVQWFGDVTNDANHFFRWKPLFTGFTTCKILRVFKEHLMLGAIEGATSEPSLIAWSDTGDFEDFNNGNSGSQTLYELTTGLQQLVNLGDRIIVYSKDALASGIFIGLPFIFAFETIIPTGTRLASAKGIVSINVGHVYLSQENVYLFDGSRGIRTLADIIRDDYKSVKDHENLHQTAMLNDYAKRTIFMALPTVDGSGVIYVLEYDAFNLASRAWTKEVYTHPPRAYGFFTNSITYTWDDTTQEVTLAATLGNTSGFLFWSDEAGAWANEGEQPDFPVRVFGDASGNVYLQTEGVFSDAGTDSLGFYETNDFTVPQEFLSTLGRWGEIEFQAKGDSVKVVAKTNIGVTDTVIEESLTLDGEFQTYRLPIDLTSRTLRVRFEFTGYFELRWCRNWVKEAAQR